MRSAAIDFFRPVTVHAQLMNEDRVKLRSCIARVRLRFPNTMLAVAGCVLAFNACDSHQPLGEARHETRASPASSVKSGTGLPVARDLGLIAPSISPGRAQNDQGISHLRAGHWALAATYFRTAIAADTALAEAHFNLGLALDRLGKTSEAKTAFRHALGLAPGNSKISQSPRL